MRLLDGTVKSILVDDSRTVNELVASIGEKMSIHNYEEFSLQLEGAAKSDWLHPMKSLHENGVPEDSLVVLKKKFFYSDMNVDRSDPVQLHLMYVQSRDSVLDGSMPTQKQEAIQLAAIQLQVEQGNYDPKKYDKAGSLK